MHPQAKRVRSNWAPEERSKRAKRVRSKERTQLALLPPEERSEAMQTQALRMQQLPRLCGGSFGAP